MIIKHKYNAKQTTIDSIVFASKKEAVYYNKLKLLKQNGDVVFFLRQVPFHLPGNLKYICDFQVFWRNGEVSFEDVKGIKTPLYIAKKKIVEELYPIKIKEI